MSLQYTVDQRPGYVIVRVLGQPTLDEFLAFVQEMGARSVAWSVRRALVDLQAVRTLTAFTEHYAIGEATARHFGHLHRLASVVPEDRLTRASEKTARRAGANLSVFTSEADAIAWLEG